MILVIACVPLRPGDPVTIWDGFKAYKSLDGEKITGIVPYSIKSNLKPGDKFWLTINGDE